MHMIQLLKLASGEEDPYEGCFVVEYEPAPMDSRGRSLPGGILRVTRNPAEAKRFATAGDALAEWRRPAGMRPDGRPNRPLTAWTVEIVPCDG